ncbi:MAG: SDR family oxidoreductase [Candidatus Peregrinibacteria bacterium]|nr:SDR family oxidoreductase [Candidatus Peregrinibacteria bacterium]
MSLSKTVSSKTILVTGGAGYVGAVLVPKLLAKGYRVKVLDLYLFGDNVFDGIKDKSNLIQIKDDLRNQDLLKKELPETDAVIHLACISNDPSFELNPALGKSINYDAFPFLVDVARDSGVQRFVYASSSSVYGIKEEANVTEDMSLEPLTDYSKYKALCEEILLKKRQKGFEVLVLRPATVCGYSPRLRLDLVVNILTHQAFTERVIKVFGGGQMRPNIHIEDMTDLYLQTLEWPAEKMDGKTYNAGWHNLPIREIANVIRGIVGPDVEIITTPTNDNRSYHISSEKLKKELGFEVTRTIDDAVRDLVNAFQAGKIPNSKTDARYYNIKTMNNLQLV